MIKKSIEFLIKDKYVYYIFLAFVLIDRIVLLQNFNFRYTGSDDLIFWQTAKDYMNGEFYAPYFYGQDYNFMLESAFAVPLLKMNVPYPIALPIATCILSLFPFFIFSYILFRKGYLTESLFFISIPLFLPIEYEIITSITRGFVSGLFFCGFLVFPLLHPHKKSSWILTAAFTTAGYIFNPNSLVFSFAICFYIFLCNFKRVSFYLIFILSALPVFLIEYFSKQFYKTHPEYVVHGAWVLQFKFDDLWKSLFDLDKYFSYMSPLIWFAGWAALVLTFVLGACFLKRDWKKGITLMTGVLFIFFTLGLNKIHDRLEGTIFLSSHRMFLAIPLLIGLAFFWGRELFTISEKQLKTALLAALFCTFFIKMSLFDLVIEHHTAQTNYGPVSIKKVDELACDCIKIKEAVTDHNIDLIVFVPSWQQHLNVPVMEFYNYGCPLLEKDLPQTLLSVYERRTWIFLKEKSAIEKNVLIYNSDIDFNKVRKMENCEIISEDNPRMFIVKNNTLPTDSLLRVFDVGLNLQ